MIIHSLAKIRVSILVAFPVLFLLLSFLVYIYVSSENTVYYWDLILYWHKYMRISPLAAKDIVQYFSSIWQSVKLDEYNNLPIIVLTPFYYLWGSSRLAFIESILTAYGILSFISLVSLIALLNRLKTVSVIALAVLFINFFLSVDVLGPILRGYVDVGGLFLVFSLFLLYAKTDWSRKITFKSIIISFLLALCFVFLPLFRRYYSYFIVSFLIAIFFVDFVFVIVQEKKVNLAWIFHYCLTLLLSLVIFILVSGNLYQSFLFANYQSLYSGWRENFSLLKAAMKLVQDFGILQAIGIVCAFIYSLSIIQYRKITILSLIIVTISILLFWRVQYFDYHHYYLILGPILIVESLALYHLLQNKRFHLIMLVAVLILWNAVQSFTPIGALPVFSGKYLPPLKREDISTLTRIIEDLNSVWISGETIYVGASSQYFSDDILRNVCYFRYTFEYSLCNNIPGAAQVDSRDGFPLKLLNAHFVIVTSPVQYHLSPNQQKTITYVNRFIERNINKYQLVNQYIIDQDINVLVYKNIVSLRKRSIDSWDDLTDSD